MPTTLCFPRRSFRSLTMRRRSGSIVCRQRSSRRKICGVKWVSVFPPNPVRHGIQNLSAVIILSEIEHGFPIAFMEGTLCSNIRVGTMGAMAAKYLARQDSKAIGFIGAGEQAKMHLIAMKTAVPSLEICRIAAKETAEEEQFVSEMSAILPDLEFQMDWL